jgi:hypothetical protein
MAKDKLEKAEITFDYIDDYGWVAMTKDGKCYEASVHEWEDQDTFGFMWMKIYHTLNAGGSFDDIAEFGHIDDDELIEEIMEKLQPSK